MSNGAVNVAFSTDGNNPNKTNGGSTAACPAQDGTTLMSISQDGSTLKSVSYTSSNESAKESNGSSLEPVINGNITGNKPENNYSLRHRSFRLHS